MTINDMLKADAGIFLADFGEDVIYLPKSGGQRCIKAIVDRDIPVRTGEGPMVAAMTITVANDPVVGISSAEVDGRGADGVMVAKQIGRAAGRMGLYLVGEGIQGAADPGMVTYELR